MMTLEQLVSRMAETRLNAVAYHAQRGNPAEVDNLDEMADLTGRLMRELGVDLDDPTAAHAVLAAWEISLHFARRSSHLRGAVDPHDITTLIHQINAFAGCAAAAADRHLDHQGAPRG